MINRHTHIFNQLVKNRSFLFHTLQSERQNVISINLNNKIKNKAGIKQLLYIKQNNFLEFFKNFRKKPQKMNDPELSSKSDEWYEIDEALIFQDKKYQILKVQNTEKNVIKFYEYGLLLPLTMYTGYKFGSSLIKLRPFRSIIWGGFFFLTVKLLKGINTNKYLFIISIDIMEDGKSCLITTAKQQMIVDIKSIRRLSQEEAVYYSHMLVQNNLEYIPIIIKNDVFLIFKNSSIFNKEIFSAITSGKYIKVKEENLINKEDAIDIK